MRKNESEIKEKYKDIIDLSQDYIGHKLIFGHYPMNNRKNKPNFIDRIKIKHDPSLSSKFLNVDFDQELFYLNGLINDCKMYYKDIENGTVRCVYFDDYMSEDKKQLSYGYKKGKVHLFDFGPIEWMILKKEYSGESIKYLLVSDIIDSKSHVSEDIYESSEFCRTRTWLNETFYNTAFNSCEKTIILDSSIEANGSVPYDSPQKFAKDKVFLPYYEDVKNSPFCYVTDYAKSQYLDMTVDEGSICPHYYLMHKDYAYRNPRWPGDYFFHPSVYRYFVRRRGLDIVKKYASNGGIRVCIWIGLK